MRRGRVVRMASGLWCVLIGYAAIADAQERQRELAPELNAYYQLSKDARAVITAGVGQNLTESVTDGEISVNLDLTLAPVFRPELRNADWSRDRYLWVRAGLALAGINEGIDLRNGYSEKRLLLEATGRAVLSNSAWLVSRLRAELRDLDGASSRRFRYRLGIEKEFTVAGYVTVPYAQAEIFYDTRFDQWNRRLFQVGAEVALSKTWRVEPYFAFQKDQQPERTELERFGLAFKYYH